MAEVNFLNAFPDRVFSNNVDSEITREDFLDIVETKENLLFYDYYTKLQYDNIKSKVKMIKKINNIYRTNESYDISESREGVVGSLVKLFIEIVKFIIKVIGMIIKGIFKFFVNLFIKHPIRRINEKRVYKAYLQRKKAHGTESYDYSTERDEPQPHRPTKPTGPVEGNDKEIADINKFMDYNMEQLVSKMMENESKDIQNMFNAIFIPNKETLNLGGINTIGTNICKAFDKFSSDTQRLATNFASHVNRDKSKEDDQSIQNEGKNISNDMNSKEFSIFNGVDISKKNWSNKVTCARRTVDYIVAPGNTQKVMKTMGEMSNMVKDKRGAMDQQQKLLEGILQKAEKQQNVEKETVNVVKGVSNFISRINKCFMCFGDIAKTLHTLLSKFEDNKDDYKERTGPGKF